MHILYQYHISTIAWFIKFNIPILLNAADLWWIIFKKYADFIWRLGNDWINLRVYMCICISCRYPFNSERGITIYLQFCSFELELSILQEGVVFLLTVFELMLFEFVWCYFLWRYLKIHGMEIESYCKIKRFLKRLQIALQIRILYFSTHHNTNKDMKYIQYERLIMQLAKSLSCYRKSVIYHIGYHEKV